MVVQHIADGFGDLLLAINLANSIKKTYRDAGLDEPDIRFLTDSEGKSRIEQLSPSSRVYSIDTLETADRLETALTSESISIERIIVAPSMSIGWLIDVPTPPPLHRFAIKENNNNQLSRLLEQVYPTTKTYIPCTLVSEYGVSIDNRLVKKHVPFGYLKESPISKMPSGLGYDQWGIVISEPPHYGTVENASTVIDKKIMDILCPISSEGSLDVYPVSSTLHFQYSHDLGAPGGCSDFIKLHHAYVQSRPGDHDLVMVGKNKKAKIIAIESIKDQLIADGFEKISFYNADTGEETFLFGNKSLVGRTYRAIYIAAISHDIFLGALVTIKPFGQCNGRSILR